MNPERLVTMQYDAVFLLYQLRYSADYEERITVKCHILSHKANNSPFCNALQLQWVTLKCRRTGFGHKTQSTE